MPAHVSHHLEPYSPRSICSPSVSGGAGHLTVRRAVDGASPRTSEALGDLHRLIDAEEELQNRFVGDAADHNHRDGDYLEHVGIRRPECTVGGVTDPHGGATGVRCNVKQEDSSCHGERRNVLWFQLLELDARLTEVPECNLDATRHGAEHEAQQRGSRPVDVPADDRHGDVQRTGHVGLERALEVVRSGGNIQVQEPRAQDEADERLPGHSDGSVDATDQARVVAVCRHDLSRFCRREQGCQDHVGSRSTVVAEYHIIPQY